MSDDGWAVFCLDVIEQPNSDHPKTYVLWAGTNHPVINELACQRMKQDAWPFTLEDFGLNHCSWQGMFFHLAAADYEDEQTRSQLADVFASISGEAAAQQGYRFQVLGPEEGVVGLMYTVLTATAMSRRNRNMFLDVYGGGDELEEEE